MQAWLSEAGSKWCQVVLPPVYPQNFTVEELDDGSAVVVTIAKYQTPKLTDINQKGIEVDLQKTCPLGKAAVACIEPDLKNLI